MRNRAGLAIGVLAVVAAAAAAAPAALVLPAGARAAAAAVDRGTLEGAVRFLADDLLEGRAPASRGDEIACRYIASLMASLGLEPGAPGGRWEQRFEIVGVTTTDPATWTFRGRGRETTLRFWDEFIAASGVQTPEVALADAELVFVGYGIQAPEYAWDDFKGADLKGKVLVMMNNDPDWDPALFAGKRRLYYGRWSYKYESAARQGAAGAIIIHTTPSAGYGWQVIQTSWTGEQYELPAAGEPRVKLRGWTTEDGMRRVVSLGGFDLNALVKAARSRDFKPVPLGVTTSLKLANALRRSETANVLGVIPGRDPVLKDQAVVFSAHHDHFGLGKPDARGDVIYNGAVDDASGVAQVLATAKAFAALPERPRRSIVFAFFSCEEYGLLGSAYYAAHPTFPAARIAADVNFDTFDAAHIFGRTKSVELIGRGKSSLDGVLEAAAALQGRTVTDERFPDRGAFYRADHFSFARIGVPVLHFKNGLDFVGRDPGWGVATTDAWSRANYHQPSDEWNPGWNYDGMIDDTQLAFFAGLSVSETDAMPTWVPGDEFARLRPAGAAR